MSGLYSHTARVEGESITDTKYNADHQNHIDNHIPEMMDDYSTDATEMQTETDPGESGSESLATSLAGELERLRYAVRELKGTTYWYQTADVSLAEVTRPNFLINGGFDVWQRGTSFTAATTPANNDTVLIADGWRLLSDGNDIVDISQTEDGPSESDFSLKALIATANTKWGICQFVEGKDSIKFSQGSQRASLAFNARCSTGATATRIRAAIIEWTGTEDDPTTDIVSAWEVQGTNPTLVANWAYVSTPSTITLTDTLTRYTVTNANVSDSATNIGVFIWMDDTAAAVGNSIFISAVQLVRGGKVGTYMPEPWINILQRCQRRYCKTFPYATAPAQNAGTAGALSGAVNAGDRVDIMWRFPVEMIKAPQVTTYNPSAAASSARNINDNTDVVLSQSYLDTTGLTLGSNSLGAGNTLDRLIIHAAAIVDF